MDPGFEAELREEEVTFTAADASLLEAIAATGSLNRAAAELGRSYSRAQKRLGTLEEAFGTLVERTRGGTGGGGSQVTTAGRELLARFERLEQGYESVASVAETVLAGTVEERDGELGVVATEAGPISAIVPPGADNVQVSIRADAVTLHAALEAPPSGGTSARNQFDGEVVSVTPGEAVARVAVDVGASTPLLALVTADSKERLDLRPGRAVVATFKATATRCTLA